MYRIIKNLINKFVVPFQKTFIYSSQQGVIDDKISFYIEGAIAPDEFEDSANYKKQLIVYLYVGEGTGNNYATRTFDIPNLPVGGHFNFIFDISSNLDLGTTNKRFNGNISVSNTTAGIILSGNCYVDGTYEPMPGVYVGADFIMQPIIKK